MHDVTDDRMGTRLDRFWMVLFAASLVLGISERMSGQEPGTSSTVGFRDVLAAEVSANRVHFRPPSQADIETARLRASASLQELDRFLMGTSLEKREGWRKYLKWGTLQEELSGDGTPSLSRLGASYARLSSGEPGLELRPFAALREDVRRVLERLQLTESAPERVPAELRRLRSAVSALDQYLALGGPAKESGWKKYLDLESVRREIVSDDPDSPTLRRVLGRFESDTEGLDRYAFRRVARALAKFEEVRLLSKQPAAARRFEARMDQLATALENYREDPSNDQVATINAVTQWLEQTGQQPDLVGRIRSRFAQPNLLLSVSADLIAREMQDVARQCQPVARCFEGSWVTGCAATDTQVQGCLVPSLNGATIQIQVSGLAVTNAVAQKRRVFVSTRSYTDLLATKRLFLTEQGLFAEPAVAQACTLQHYRGACVNRRFGRRLITRGAQRKAEESRLRAQCVASGDAQGQLSQKMDQQAQEMLAKSNAQLNEMKANLRKQGLYPERVTIASTCSHLLVDAVSRDGRSLATAEAPPTLPACGDFGVRLHQSAVNNAIARTMGGIKVDSDTVVQLLEKYKLEVPAELRPQGGEAEDEKWSITFDSDLPASVTFVDNRVRVSIRGRKFTRGDQEVRDRIEISGEYQLLRTTDGYLVAERVGELDVRFVDVKRKLSSKQLSYKVFLKRKFEALFKDQMTTYELPDDPQIARIKDLMLNDIQAIRGWLTTSLSVRPGVRLNKKS